MPTKRTMPKRRIVELAMALGLFGPVATCPEPAPDTGVAARPPGLRRFAYRVARPIFDPSAQSRLYISSYAGRRPTPRAEALAPTGYAAPRAWHASR